MKIVFVIAIFDSFGERQHALSFAEQLRAAGHETTFLATGPSLPHLRARGADVRAFASADDARRIVAELAPDWIVACEWFNLPGALCEVLAGARCRLATLDGTGMGAAINPAAARPLPPGMVRLQPCPVNAPAAPTDGVFAWPLFPDVKRSDGAAPRTRWGIARETKIAMLALAPWAVAAARRLGREAHYPALVHALVSALAATQIPVELIVISPEPPTTRRRDLVTLRFSPYLPADVYDELLMGSDLVLSDNLIQTSLSKAFVARIQTLVIVDSRPPAWNIFPLTLRFPVDAPYTRAVDPVELGDAAALRARVAAALAGDARDDHGYRAALAALPSPAAILASAL